MHKVNIYINEKNLDHSFWSLNQWDNYIQHYMCTLFSAANNLKYNKGYKYEITEKEIERIAEIQHDKGLFDYNYGWYAIHGYEAIAEYMWMNFITFTKDDPIYEDLLSKWFAVWVWFSVNKNFANDSKDGKLSYDNYMSYVWEDLKHLTNVIQWIHESEDKGKQMIYDNYAFSKDRQNLIECNLEELKKVQYTTCYAFI